MIKSIGCMAVFIMIISGNGYRIMAQENDGVYYQPQQNAHQGQKPLGKDTLKLNTRELKDYHAILSFDPLGFLTLGPSINIEPAIGKYIGVNASIRFHNLGLLQYLLHGSMNMSYIISGSIRIYPKPKNKIDHFYFGPGVGYGRSNYKSGSKYDIRNFGGEIGYRWRCKNGIFFELSDNIGVVQSRNIKYDDEWSTDMFVFYLLSAKIGIGF
jgi:hypothetical protein